MGSLSVVQTIWASELPELSQIARLDIDTNTALRLVIHDPVSGQRVELPYGPGPWNTAQATRHNVHHDSRDIDIDGATRGVDSATIDRLGGVQDSARAYLDGIGFAGNLASLHLTSWPGQNYLLAARQTGSGVSVHQVENNGALTRVAQVNDNNTRMLDRVIALDSIELGGRRLVVAASATENGLTVFEQNGTGSLSLRGSFGLDDQLPVNQPSGMELIESEGRAFVILTSFASGSLTVMELNETGSLTFVDQVNDSAATRFGGVAALATTTVDGRTWIAVAGNDGGVTVFQLLPGGRLLHRDTLVDTDQAALRNISQLQFVQVADQVELLALAPGESGITRIALDAGPAGGAVATNGNDVLEADAAGGPLVGLLGDDVLIDGAGSDILSGGGGADVFVFRKDGEADTIADFNPAHDRIDLSAFGGAHSLADFDVAQISGGLTLTRGDETLTIQTAGGGPLNSAQLTPGLLFDSDHILIPDPLPQIGGDGADVFEWRDGPDTIDGGAGVDLMRYDASLTPAEVDLQDNSANARAALGDVLLNIESLEGTKGNDIFLGTGVANTLTGNEGNDSLHGRGGNDWFNPGKGRDTIDGGAGSDMVSFSDHQWAIRVDLNAGSAEGNNQTDSLTSIENVTGTVHGDYIRGDENDNRIRGLGDYDWLVGSGGRDSFDGGNGRDMVSYVNAPSGVIVNLGTGRGTAGQADGDTYTAIERVTGSVHNDQLYGGAGEEDLRGLGGYDWFIGSGGGKDRYDGGNGSDTVAYWHAGSGVTASLRLGRGSTGDAARDLYTSIENLAGSSHDDNLTGDDGRNTLRGYWGEDVLIGGGGVDRLIGGGSDDVLDGGSGWDYAVFSGNRRDYDIQETGDETRVTHLTGNEGTDTLIQIEALLFADDIFYL